MAVYTKLSEKDLIEFLSKYNIGKNQKHEEIKEGIENTNYLIQTEKGKFILTLYEKRVDEKDLPFFISLMRNLFDKFGWILEQSFLTLLYICLQELTESLFALLEIKFFVIKCSFAVYVPTS